LLQLVLVVAGKAPRRLKPSGKPSAVSTMPCGVPVLCSFCQTSLSKC